MVHLLHCKSTLFHSSIFLSWILFVCLRVLTLTVNFSYLRFNWLMLWKIDGGSIGHYCFVAHLIGNPLVFAFVSVFRVSCVIMVLFLSLWLTVGPIFPGSRGNGHVLCAGLWSNLRIWDHMVMGRRVYLFSCSKEPYCKNQGVFPLLKLRIVKAAFSHHYKCTGKFDCISVALFTGFPCAE